MKVLCVEHNRVSQTIPTDAIARYAEEIEKSQIPPSPGKLEGVDAVIINTDGVPGVRDWIAMTRKARPNLPIVLFYNETPHKRPPQQAFLEQLGADYVVSFHSPSNTQELFNTLKEIRNTLHRPTLRKTIPDRVIAEKAEELCLKPVVFSNEIHIDGQRYCNDATSVYIWQTPESSDLIYAERLSRIGTFHGNTNNAKSILGFIDEKGALRLTSFNQENVDTLIKAGYSECKQSFPMPFTSAHESMEAPYLEERLRAILNNTPVASSETEALAGSIAAEKGIGEVDTSRFFRTDATVFRKDQEHLVTIPKNTLLDDKEKPIPNPHRINHIGEYCTTDGVLGFIDPKGHLYIGKATEENIQLLKRAHYTAGNFDVPYAHQKGELSKPITYAHLRTGTPDQAINKFLREQYEDVMQIEKSQIKMNARE